MQPKKKKFIYIILLTGILLVFFWERDKLSSTLDAVENEGKSALTNSMNISPNSSAPAEANSNQISSAETSIAAKTPEQFASWLKNEASSVDHSDPRNSEKEVVLRQQVLQFTPENIRYLRFTATNAKAPANEKIVATYLLTIGSSNSLQALEEIAQSPFSLISPQPAHSIGEATLMQEKAIRVVAIDELFIRLENDAITRQEFEGVIQKIPDPSLRQYAIKRLAELK